MPTSCWEREPAVCGLDRLVHHDGAGHATAVPVSSSPAVVTGAGVVFAAGDGTVRFYDRELSKVFWRQRLDSPVYASLVVDAERRHVVVAATSGLVVCFDLRGSVVWSTETGVPVYATPTRLPGSDVLMIAAFTSRAIGLDLATGVILFDRAVPRPWHAEHGGSAAHRDPYASPVATANGTAVLACGEHALCLAPDGTELWRHDLGVAVKASPVAIHETGDVMMCPVDGRCVFMDSATGSERGHTRLGAKVIGSPAVSEGVVVAGTQHGTVTAFDADARAVRWTAPFGASREYTSFTVLPNGDFAATSTRGNIVALRRADGGFLWETTQVLGLVEHETAMDITPVVGPDGSMYCASYTGSIYHFRFQPTREEDQ
ncbi:outer membrane protein assembly factor BamB family protein [Amycolatopsis sulphurea]|uniref:outer membrane protein assembly factor BamB family protein n=1 Tax=Amycolatopsis sulphurea TaxID=76022 RepID=UPI001473C687|nr:PQQ-binding-like beta-propeller repeat protein [Amycolatopsis sulphurea]